MNCERVRKGTDIQPEGIYREDAQQQVFFKLGLFAPVSSIVRSDM
jgi:hypothetical protein